MTDPMPFDDLTPSPGPIPMPPATPAPPPIPIAPQQYTGAGAPRQPAMLQWNMPQTRYQPRPRQLAPQPRPQSWAGLVVLLFLLLGVAVSWIGESNRALSFARSQTEAARNAWDLLAAQQFDLGRMLSDPKTTIIHLIGGGETQGQALVAWNPVSRDGVLFCQPLKPLPDGREYRLCFDVANQRNTAALIEPSPGRSVYPFHVDASLARPAQVELISVIAGESSDAPGAFVLSHGAPAADESSNGVTGS